MSADLLRRAAEKLRHVVAELPTRFQSEWRAVLTDSESLTGVASCLSHEGDPINACNNCEDIECWYESVPSFLLAIQPSVALALADWLNATADRIDALIPALANEVYGVDDPPAYLERTYAHPIAVAHAVLREDGEST